ncbi:MAG: penicillin acylase family protein [Anditalea sp.]
MKYFEFLLSLIVALMLAIGLSLNFGQIPPLAGLLDPYHGFWQNAYSEDDLAVDEMELKNISAPVEVVYDINLIPHIFAANEADLYRAQGFITAKHRLWQMEFQTMAAAGRISEIVGSQAIEYDRMQRRKGLGFGAEAGMSYLKSEDPETLRLITAYSDGVNQYIDQLQAAQLPVEYKLLNYPPEHWTAFKTVLLLKYMADMLVGDKDLEFTNLRHIIGPEWMEKLFPDFPLENDPVIESSKEWDFVPLPIERPEDINYPDSSILIDPMLSPEPGIGSNNWAVAGKKTENGYPILANDPHLNLNMPSLWFAMQLTTPGHSAKGATLPGALGVICGFNEDIAWGVTNATRDVRDWYAITFKNGSRLEYLYNDQWIQSTKRIEEIQVKNELPYIDTVIYTHYGPVVYDKTFSANAQNVNFALKWTAHDGSNEQRTFLELNKGENHADFINGLNHYTSPAQNFVFASTTGNIAMKVQGKFPLKWEEQGKYLMEGNNPAFEWKGTIPPDHNPATFNPDRGFVSSANQHSVDPSYPYYVFDNSFEHYRNRRLNSILNDMNTISIEDMKALQLDNLNLHAFESLPVMLAYLLEDPTKDFSPTAEELLMELQEWDFHAFPDQSAPPLFASWWENFEELAWGKWKERGRPIVFPNNYQTTQLMREEPESVIFDNPETELAETARELVAESFERMVQEIGTWRETGEDPTWANFKKTSIQHLVPNFAAFGFFNIPTGGGKGMINATGERHGASWRMVVEMGDEIKAFGIYPGGQSGNPGSRFYDNMIEKWAKGEYVNFNPRKAEDQDDVLFRTTFITN